jgi:endonuclease/exonuclease/phosphatase family metal-dependent hydrolase
MAVRVATFNMENLFRRPQAMNVETWDEGRVALDAVARLNELLAHDPYTEADKKEIAGILTTAGLAAPQPKGALFRVNQVREKLYVVKRGTGEIEVVADGRGDWLGWVELTTDELAWGAIENTGRVVDAIRPDVLLCVEVEDRPALQRFNDLVLTEKFPAAAFPYNVLIDGNDTRGIDIGLLSRFPIVNVRTHIFDGAPKEIFSRDCPEYEVLLPDGGSLWILGNHFKSKGYGDAGQSARRRLGQAGRVREIYQEALRRSGYVIVAGDLNDTPDSPPLRALGNETGLRDVMTHSGYSGRPGTYGTGNTPSSKIDYLLLSPALWPKVTSVDVERRGIWAPRGGNPFPTVTGKTTQASDHGAVYVDLEL